MALSSKTTRSTVVTACPARAIARTAAPAARATLKATGLGGVTLKRTERASVAVQSSASKDTQGVVTLTTWLFREEAAGTIDSELAIVLSSVALACKQISSLVARSGISGMTGLAGAANIQGEDQKKLDVISNEIFCDVLRNCGRTGTIASEEEDLPVAVEETFSGNYVVVFDPLDGSSNIDAGISVGSIFGIYEPSPECKIDDMDDPKQMMENCVMNVCQPGHQLKSAGYVLYSSASIFVLTIGDGVYGFTLDPLVGEFVMSHPDIKIPDAGKIYSFNEGNYQMWDDATKRYMDSLKKPELWDGTPYSARYIGSLVGDFHRTLLYGGIYGYPADAKNKTGKLRLLYECAPMSFIAEQAGGLGSDGQMRVMDIDPTEVHQRVPLFIGSKKEVEYLESFTKGGAK